MYLFTAVPRSYVVGGRETGDVSRNRFFHTRHVKIEERFQANSFDTEKKI
jgi:hypothetical protein